MKSHSYFSDLNYTLANEDTQVEYNLLSEGKTKVFSIAGSGARCLPLVAKNPKELVLVDMAEPQLFLAELRIQAARALNYEEWLFFMGYRGAIQGESLKNTSRTTLLDKIELRSESKAYWLRTSEYWNDTGFIKLGKWEQHFQKIGKIFRDYLQCDFSAIFAAETLEKQILMYEETWPRLRMETFLRIVASEFVFNKFLYKGHFSGSKSLATEKLAPWEFLLKEFDRVFRNQIVRKNYFFQTLFLGQIRYEEGLPLEAHRKTHQAVKESQTQVTYRKENLVEVIKVEPFDFYSLSDTISYLDSNTSNGLLQLLPGAVPSQARVVIRSFLRAPQAMNESGFHRLKSEEVKALNMDGTSVYQFHIYEKV